MSDNLGPIGQALMSILVGFVMLVYFFPSLKGWLAAEWEKRFPNPRTSRERSTLGQAQSSRGDGQWDYIGALGSKSPPQQSADMIVLRPTLGIRLAQLAALLAAIAACVVGYAFPDHLPGGFPPLPPSVYFLLGVTLCVYGVTQTGRDVRMNDQVLVVRSSWMTSRDYLWSELTAFNSADERDYQLVFTNGRKARVSKHLTGVEVLLERVGRALKQNAATVR